jgi:hypothetical protein
MKMMVGQTKSVSREKAGTDQWLHPIGGLLGIELPLFMNPTLTRDRPEP